MKDSDAGEGGAKSRDELDVWVPAAVQGKNYTKEIPLLLEMNVQTLLNRDIATSRAQPLGSPGSPFRCNPLPTVIDSSFHRSGPPSRRYRGGTRIN